MSKRAKDTTFAKKRRKIRARFRGMVHMVMINKTWLQDQEEQNISTNVKQNIAMRVRKQQKIGILTMAEKALIRSPVWMRTVEQRKKLVTLMLNLECFSKYPPKICARLASVVKFIYLTAGRYITKAGPDRYPFVVYFILTGEVEVSTTVYDDKKKEYIEKLEFVCGPGDCIGDSEFLERIPRVNTRKTTNNVELLAVYEDDFDRILRPYMEKQWEQKQNAVAAFDYFKDWSTDQKSSACKECLLKQYEPLETIYYEDKGLLTYVQFVISGQCMILQCLKMNVTERKGKKIYSLVDISEGDESQLFSTMTNKDIWKQMRQSKVEGKDTTADESESVHSSEPEEDVQAEEEVAGIYRKARKSDYKKYALICGVDLNTARRESKAVFDEAIHRLSAYAQIPGRLSTTNTRNSIKMEAPHKVENHFIDVGSLTFGGIFGLGEKLEHRVVMARTTVQCLLIPRYWLFAKAQNPGNVWQKMRLYLDSTIPSREILFQDFLATRKWQQFKKQLINETLDDTKVGNPTKVQDIPIICRIVEANDDDDSEGP